MNFDQIADGIYAGQLLALIRAQPELWGEITIRQDYPGSAHRDTDCIFLRGPRTFTPDDYFEDLGAYDYPAMDKLMPAIFDVMRPVLDKLEVSELGRVLIVRLHPAGVITPHIDEGRYAEHFSRFHISLQSDPGNSFTCGEETVHMAPGTAWWFNHRELHTVTNDSDRERIHIIFDAVTPHYTVHIPAD